jgi:hypothetical protein
MKTDDEYTKSLESVLAQVLKPLKGIPFPVVMKSLAQKAVLPFDKGKPEPVLVLQKVELGRRLTVEKLTGQESSPPVLTKRATLLNPSCRTHCASQV